MHTALGWLPPRLNERAAASVPMIVVLPANTLDIQGASFDLTRAVLVFENERENDDEEILTTFHEIFHMLDPGWQFEALNWALKKDKEKCPISTWRKLVRVGPDAFERGAELAAWELADVSLRKQLPHAAEIVHQALYWEG